MHMCATKPLARARSVLKRVLGCGAHSAHSRRCRSRQQSRCACVRLHALACVRVRVPNSTTREHSQRTSCRRQQKQRCRPPAGRLASGQRLASVVVAAAAAAVAAFVCALVSGRALGCDCNAATTTTTATLTETKITRTAFFSPPQPIYLFSPSDSCCVYFLAHFTIPYT